MFTRFIVLVLIALTTKQINSNQSFYQLSPPLPPTAFFGQFYTCQFRVSGLSFPAFRFEGLPQGIKGDPSGVVKGIPQQQGSFLITVYYSTDSYQASKQTIIRVSVSANSPTGSDTLSSLLPRFTISADKDTLVYMAGTEIKIKFSATMGKAPFSWAYLRLPSQLIGTTDGIISGYFSLEGYYSFGVTCADSLGVSVDSYFTLNIQPVTFFFQWQPQIQRDIVDVPVRDYIPKNIRDESEKLKKSATDYLSAASQKVNQARAALVEAQRNLAKSNYTIYLANLYLQSAKKKLADQTSSRQFSLKYINKTINQLVLINKTYLSKANDFIIIKSAADEANKTVQISQKTFSSSNSTLEKSNKDFISAQNQTSSAFYAFKLAQMDYNDQKSSTNLTFSLKQLAQQKYKSTLSDSSLGNQNVQQSQSALTSAKQAVTIAAKTLAQMSNLSDQAMQALRRANQEVDSLRKLASSAKEDIGAAKYNLTLALNQLYVAQAAKQQIDKSLQLIRLQQTSYKNSSTVFLGCNQNAYPSYFGAGRIKVTSDSFLILESNKQLLFGECTSMVSCSSGDLITFEGYIKNGTVHLIKISKVTFN